MKHSILVLLMMFLPKMASAFDAEINGIFYNLDDNAKTAEVTYLEKFEATYSGTVVIPDEVTYSDITYSVTAIGDQAFYNCSELIWVTIPVSVTSIGERAFYYCSGLTSVTLPSSIISIGKWAFYNCSGLTSVNILCSPADYNPDYNSIFSGCDNLKEAVFDCETVTNLLANNNSLEKLTMTEKVTSIDEYAFSGCSGLTSVTIPSSVTSIGNGAFFQCSGLTSVTILCSPTDIGYTPFSECNNLKEAVFDCNTVTTIFKGNSVEKVTMTEKVTSIDEYAFSNCTSLTSVDISNSVTSIGGHAFGGCNYLKSIDIPDGVISIDEHAFYNCSGLKSVTIGDGVTSIGEYAFYGCGRLTDLSLGKSVNDIGNYAFYSSYFKDVYCYAETLPNTGNRTFQGSNTNNATLHVHRASINTYKLFEPWKSFKEIVTIEAPEKCATPEIVYENGELTFSCETEEVEYVTKITSADKDKFNTDKINLTGTYTVSVYAKKEYYLDSDVATMEIRLPGIDKSDIFGDLNSDDKVDANDAVKLVDIIMGK